MPFYIDIDVYDIRNLKEYTISHVIPFFVLLYNQILVLWLNSQSLAILNARKSSIRSIVLFEGWTLWNKTLVLFLQVIPSDEYYKIIFATFAVGYCFLLAPVIGQGVVDMVRVLFLFNR